MDERLQKIISQWGIASRRQAEQLILEGKVRLNGGIVQLGQKANPDRDQIEVDGVLIQPNQRPETIYILMNKPRGVVSTCDDPWHRRTVLDLLPPHLQTDCGVHPVGRLDADSTGALLLTNNGAITHSLTHPSHQILKTYRVWVEGRPSANVLEQWRTGVSLAGRVTLPAKITVVDGSRTKQTLLEIGLQEGRNRQIRRIAEQLGHPVVRLHRTSIGAIHLQQLPIGQYRFLSDLEINSLKDSVQSLDSPLRVPTTGKSDRG
jgi:23S rRNA pseudouridine2605 synthase